MTNNKKIIKLFHILGLIIIISMIIFTKDHSCLFNNGDTSKITNITQNPKVANNNTLWQKPVVLSSYLDSDEGVSYYIRIINKTGYLADGLDGLEIIDLSKPGYPEEFGSWPKNASDFNETMGEEYLFRYVDIQQKNQSNTLAYVADFRFGLRVLNITNTSAIDQIGTYNKSINDRVDTPYHQVHLYDNDFILAISYNGFIDILNVSNPQNITLISRYNQGLSSVFGLTLKNELAFVSDFSEGIFILNLTDISNINQISKFGSFGSYKSFYIRDDIGYLTNGANGFSIWDISDINNVMLLTHYIPEESLVISDIASNGDYTFVMNSNGQNLLYAFDTRDLNNITMTGKTPEKGRGQTMFFFDTFIAISTVNGGIKIITDGIDDDGDGIYNILETYFYFTNPNNPDTDGDNISDGDEIYFYNTNASSTDSDGDNLSDYEEIFNFGTNPINDDTDFDGLRDDLEIYQYNTDPLDPDSDNDGLLDGEEVFGLLYKKSNQVFTSDPLDPDSDNDGLIDGDEFAYGSFPNTTDTDGDGLLDGEEVHELGTDPTETDTDRDLIPDNKDLNPTSSLVPFGFLVFLIIIGYQVGKILYDKIDWSSRKIQKFLKREHPIFFSEISSDINNKKWTAATEKYTTFLKNNNEEKYDSELLEIFFKSWIDLSKENIHDN